MTAVAIVLGIVMQTVHQQTSRVIIAGYFVTYLVFIVLLTPAMLSRWRFIDQRLKKIEQYREAQCTAPKDDTQDRIYSELRVAET